MISQGFISATQPPPPSSYRRPLPSRTSMSTANGPSERDPNRQRRTWSRAAYRSLGESAQYAAPDNPPPASIAAQ